jgi:hypothetical protein
MFRWIRKKLKLSPKKLSYAKLSALATKKKRKDWERILDKMAEYAVSMAEQGKTFFTVNQDLLMNEYNKERTKDQILKDVRKRFPRCECHFDFTILGQENIRISWQKKIDN